MSPQAVGAVAHAGKDRLVHNVVSGWVAHLVAIVIGFIMPRLIDESVGQAALGVWDLGWSLLIYLGVSGLGVAAAVTHGVSRDTAAERDGLLAESIATAFYCQLGLAVALGLLVAMLFVVLPQWAPEAFSPALPDMHLIGLFLGLATATSLVGDVAQGILVGQHRTSWNEYLNIASDVLLALAMIGVLLLGGGIAGLAMATFAVRLAGELARFALALRLCPRASLRPDLCRLDHARWLIRFGTKSSLGITQELLVHQGARILLAVSAGPVVLACYSRYQTLVRQVLRLMDRSVRVLPPITTHLLDQRRPQEIERLWRQASRATMSVALPVILVVAVLGDLIIRVWMGPDFVVPNISWILAAMALMQVDYSVASRVLMGMNAHGRIAARCFAAALLLFGLCTALLFPFGAVEAAISVAVSLGLGVFLPHYFLACARLGVGPGAHFRDAYLRTLLANLPFLAGLLVVRWLIAEGAMGWAATALTGAAAILLVLYWRFGVQRLLQAGLRRATT